jgi:hypothetical protein
MTTASPAATGGCVSPLMAATAAASAWRAARTDPIVELRGD